MKRTLARITILLTAIIFSTTMFAQENPKKQPAKALAEKGAKGDVILGRNMQKKQLNAPLKMHSPDSAKLPQKKYQPVKKPKNSKS
jgi:hypothetical protein